MGSEIPESFDKRIVGIDTSMVVEERFRVMAGNSDVKSVASDTTAWVRDGTSEASTAVKEAASGTGTDTSELRIDCRDFRSGRVDGMFVLNLGISGVVSELRIRMLAVGRGTLGMMALKIEVMSGS